MLQDIFAPREVRSREHLIQEIRNALDDSLEQVIDTHNTASVIFVFNTGDKRHLLKAEFGSETATHHEIRWYSNSSRTFKNTPKHLDSYAGQTYALLLLEYIEEASSIDDIALGGNGDATLIGCILRSFDLDRQLFEQTADRVSQSYVSQLHASKYTLRRSEAGETPYLSDVLNMPKVIINGKLFDSSDVALAKIQRSQALTHYLSSDKLGSIHGDLHCGNILLKDNDIFWIDPNGRSKLPIEYDLGKIFHSIHGNFGSIMRGKYHMSQIASSQFVFSCTGPDIYKETFQCLKQSLTDQEYARGLYAEAMHFATMLSHHVKSKQETLALYLCSVQLLNELRTIVA